MRACMVTSISNKQVQVPFFFILLCFKSFELHPKDPEVTSFLILHLHKYDFKVKSLAGIWLLKAYATVNTGGS